MKSFCTFFNLMLLACAAVFLSGSIAYGQTGGSSLVYRVDSAARQKHFQMATAKARQANAATGELYEIIATKSDVYTIVADYLKKYGMRADDLGDVFAVNFYSNWIIAQGKTDHPTQQQLNGIRLQGSKSNAFNRLALLSDLERQKVADTMMLNMVVQQALMQKAQASDPASVAKLAAQFTDFNQAGSQFVYAEVFLSETGFQSKTSQQQQSYSSSAAPTAREISSKRTTAQTIDISTILGVRFESRLQFMAGGPAGFLQRFERAEVLFKDGTSCYDCLADLLTDPTLTQYRKSDPSDVGSWKKVGAKYLVSYPGSKEPLEIEEAMVRKPAPKGTILSGRFETSGGMTVGGVDNYTSTTYSEDLIFTRDGRFSWGSAGGLSGSYDSSTVVGYNKDAAKTGRYTIEGYTIRLDFDDGRSELKSFVYFPKEPKFLVIDDSAYWTPDD